MAKHDKAYDQVAVPSAGGTTRAGKDSSNEKDALGHPGKHHGEHTQAVIVSGKGPAAATKQMTTGRIKGINSDKSFERPSDQEDMKW